MTRSIICMSLNEKWIFCSPRAPNLPPLWPTLAYCALMRAFDHWSQWTMMAVAVISVVALFCWITSSVTA
ncbi:Uncharacterised protein [Vibrio cholerae]|nr:Uncharacterised protein [Vibrio cholerae]